MKMENDPVPSLPPETPHSQDFDPNLPMAPARVAVLKATYRQAWLYFLLGICMLVAWGVPLRYAILRWLAFRPSNTGPRDAYEFVALAYEGISENPREVSPQRFKEQVAALRQAGYTAITLQDVKALYKDAKPLPRKAILMTFDHSRKSSYFDARSILMRAGWSAVMFLWTKPILDEDPASLRWPYIRAMLRSGAWEAGAQSHDGFQRVVADNAGTRRNFMTTPQWSGSEMRYETPDEFSRRLMTDHDQCRQLIEQETGDAPLAYAFPYGDFGQYDERAILSRRLNLDIVSKYYDLGFILGNAALNTRYSDPRRLNRLLVNPAWSGAELVQRLDYAWPRNQGYVSKNTLDAPLAWLVDWGGFQLQAGAANLMALPETTGAKVWLNGSDNYKDFRGQINLHITEGQVGLFFRATPDGESYLYLGIGDDGNVWLRQKHSGMQPFTLASGRYVAGSNGLINLSVFLRDRLFFASINDRPVFQEIAATRGETRPGMIGCSVWYPEAGAARAQLESLELHPFTASVVTWSPVTSRAAPLAYWLNRNAYRYSHLAPPWLRVASRGMVEQFGWNASTFATFAAIYRMKFVPEVIMDNLDQFEASLPDMLASRTAGIKAAGILCNLRDMSGAPPLSRIITWIQGLSRAMDAQGLTLVVRLPQMLEKPATLSALFQVLPNLQIAVAPDSPLAYEAESGNNVSNRVVTAEVAQPYQDVELSLYYELSGLSSTSEVWSSEMRSELLRQEGRTAYNAGDFQKAIEIWSRWMKLEPLNEEPISLVGDVYLRLGDVAKALEFYRRSLEVNPGQIGLAVRTARLLDTAGDQGAEAQKMLNLYARLFPNNPDIALAQAEWLVRRKRRDEAGALIRQVIALYPEDLRALTMLHSLLRTPQDRFDNMRAMIAVGSRPGMEQHLAQAIRDRDLFTRPESWMLMDFLEKQAERVPTGPEHDLYVGLLPRTNAVAEDFRVGRMSPNWITSADDSLEEGGNLILGADPTQTEAFLRLLRSDALHNGYIETLIEDARGFFWTYARRGEGNMVRFGFDHTGKMYLQVWRDGQMISNESRFWSKPSGAVRLRLEIRGDGAFGFVDGKPAFGSPVSIPRDMGLGWWGIAPWAPQFGVAQVSVRQVAGGPLPVRVGVFKPRDEAWLDSDYLEILKAHTRDMSAIGPQWYGQDIEGHVQRETTEDHSDLRILCRYYRIRLLPTVRSVSPRNLNVEELIQLALDDRLDGFTLLFSKMPDKEWFEKVERALQDTTLSILAVQLDEHDKIAQVREMCPFVGLFPGARRVHTLPLIPAKKAAGRNDEMPMDERTSDAILLF